MPATLPTPAPGELASDYQRRILELWHLEVARLQAMINEAVDRKARRERAEALELERKQVSDAKHKVEQTHTLHSSRPDYDLEL